MRQPVYSVPLHPWEPGTGLLTGILKRLVAFTIKLDERTDVPIVQT